MRYNVTHMDAPIVIDRLNWDEWNLKHIEERHQISQIEVEGACHADPVFLESRKGRLMAIAPTKEGRILAVVIGPAPDDPGAWYTFSARPASRKERAYYHQQRGGGTA